MQPSVCTKTFHPIYDRLMKCNCPNKQAYLLYPTSFRHGHSSASIQSGPATAVYTSGMQTSQTWQLSFLRSWNIFNLIELSTENITWPTYSKPYSFLSEKTSMSLVRHENTAISMTISITKLKSENGQTLTTTTLWGERGCKIFINDNMAFRIQGLGSVSEFFWSTP